MILRFKCHQLGNFFPETMSNTYIYFSESCALLMLICIPNVGVLSAEADRGNLNQAVTVANYSTLYTRAVSVHISHTLSAFWINQFHFPLLFVSPSIVLQIIQLLGIIDHRQENLWTKRWICFVQISCCYTRFGIRFRWSGNIFSNWPRRSREISCHCEC